MARRGPAPACHRRWHCLHLLQRMDDFGHVVQLTGVGLEGELHLHAAAKAARMGELARGRALRGSGLAGGGWQQWRQGWGAGRLQRRPCGSLYRCVWPMLH
jgi:hypothetical protein